MRVVDINHTTRISKWGFVGETPLLKTYFLELLNDALPLLPWPGYIVVQNQFTTSKCCFQPYLLNHQVQDIINHFKSFAVYCHLPPWCRLMYPRPYVYWIYKVFNSLMTKSIRSTSRFKFVNVSTMFECLHPTTSISFASPRISTELVFRVREVLMSTWRVALPAFNFCTISSSFYNSPYNFEPFSAQWVLCGTQLS